MVNSTLRQRFGDPDKTLFLVDISSFIFRAFYAIRVLHNKKGEPTNAVYGVATMLAKLVEQAGSKNVAVVYDSPEPSFRHEVYEDYKANRGAPPDDLEPQFDRIEQLVDALRIPSFRQSGVEADDLIATLTKKWVKKSGDHRVVIVSSDKDLMQLVNGRIVAWDTMKDRVFGSEEVEAKFGIGPKLVRDYLALVGDSSDNVPGVPSIGPKSAVTLLKEFESFDGVLKGAQAGKIKGKKGEVIQQNVEQARLSWDLVGLKDNLKADPVPDKVRYDFKVTDECVELLRELDFHTLVSQWSKKYRDGKDGQVAKEVQVDNKQFQSVDTDAALNSLLKQIEKKGEFAFDLETTSLNPRDAQVVGVGIAVDSEVGYYIPLGHREGKQLDRKKVLQQLRPYLENPRYKKIGQNLKYDWSVLFGQGINPDGIGGDMMIAAYVLDPSGRHNFDALCMKYLNYETVKYSDICGKGKNQIGFDEVKIDIATRYAAEDALYTLKLWHLFKEKLEKEKLMEVFAAVDLPLVSVLARMEWAGVSIDQQFLQGLSKEFHQELDKIEKKIQSFTKEPINLNSPKQLGKLLFEDLKLPVQSKTKTGYSTDAKVLDTLSSMHEVPKLLLEYREISKLLGTYVDPLPQLVDKKTDKIHAGFHQTVAATGRLSSSDPNLQNIPIRTQRGQLIRKAFIPSPGNVLLAADYSQIELRILADMSGDPELVKSFQTGEDVHRRTASEIFDIKPEEVNDQQRGVAKAINFGLMYGKTAFGLSQELKISRKEAKEMIEKYFSRYRDVKKFLDGLIEGARDKGWVLTRSGRKRNLPDIHSKNFAVRGNAERMAMNTPIQGTAADMIKQAMITLDEKLLSGKYKSKLIIQVHDELVLDCIPDELDQVTRLVVGTMEGAMKLKVPLVVNVESGANWMEL